jgi:hypothetical protein
MPVRARVDVFRLEHALPVLAARVTLDHGRVSISGDDALVADLRAGVVHPLTGEALTPEDGWSFAFALASVYRSPYLYATEVIREEG